MAFTYLQEAQKKDAERLFTTACSEKAKGNGFKMKEGRLTQNIRKKFVMVSVVRCCNRLSREAAGAPSPEMSKTRLDGALSTRLDGALSNLT